MDILKSLIFLLLVSMVESHPSFLREFNQRTIGSVMYSPLSVYTINARAVDLTDNDSSHSGLCPCVLGRSENEFPEGIS